MPTRAGSADCPWGGPAQSNLRPLRTLTHEGETRRSVTRRDSARDTERRAGRQPSVCGVFSDARAAMWGGSHFVGTHMPNCASSSCQRHEQAAWAGGPRPTRWAAGTSSLLLSFMILTVRGGRWHYRVPGAAGGSRQARWSGKVPAASPPGLSPPAPSLEQSESVSSPDSRRQERHLPAPGGPPSSVHTRMDLPAAVAMSLEARAVR